MMRSRALRRKLDLALLAAGAAAAAFAVAAIAAEPVDKLEDVQIGERGDILRVALICRSRCDIVPGDGVEFRINGVSAALDIDLSGRSALARRLTISPAGETSVVTLDSAASVNEARVVACKSDTGEAPCIEYRFAPGARPAAIAATKKPAPPRTASTAENRADSVAGEKPRPAEGARDIPFIGALTLTPGRGLRDQPASGLIYLPDFGPPERLAAPPPSPPPAQEREAPREQSENSAAGSKIVGARVFDVEAETSGILGKSLDVGACEGAKARLMGDAWALDAMIDLAFCKAVDGRLAEADADFARLLDYTPDNYEALVGRGIVAMAQGDRRRGVAFYQEALNALPPIAESDRIVAAMRRN